MVSTPLWEMGHCGTGDLGSMSVQSVTRGAHSALARSLVQRALSRVGTTLLPCLATGMYCHTGDRSTGIHLWTEKIIQFPT